MSSITKTITVYKVTAADKAVAFQTKAQATKAQAMLNRFGIEATIEATRTEAQIEVQF